MANIKVSEMATATTFENDDYVMIIQNNKNKKITRQNILENIEDDISDLNALSTENSTKINNLSTYSTNEIVIGTWLGKPLYRKVFSFPDPVRNLDVISIADIYSTMDRLVSISGTAYYEGYSQWYNIPNTHEEIAKYYIDALIVNQNLQVRLGNGFPDGLTRVNVILEYTKTTD